MGEYSYPETMTIYDGEYFKDGFEVTVDHIAMGWVQIPSTTSYKIEGLYFMVGLYLDEATCTEFAAIMKAAQCPYETDWSNTILFILDHTEGETTTTYYCFASIGDDGTWYWAVTVATAAPTAETP